MTIEFLPTFDNGVENPFRAIGRILSSKKFWLNFLFIVLAFMALFISKKMSSISNISSFPNLIVGLGRILILSACFSIFGVVLVFVYESFYLKVFRFKKYFLIEKYLWALILPFCFAFLTQFNLKVKLYIPFTVIFSLVLAVSLMIYAWRNGKSKKLLALLSLPVTFAVFFGYGTGIILRMAYCAVLLRPLIT